jgi:tetratricopeptide (TPR) repeat protein
VFAAFVPLVQAAPEPTLQPRSLKGAILSFHASILTLPETPTSPSPHLEILFEVERGNNQIHAHHLPGWLRLALDRLPPVEHTYSDAEWHALSDGALQRLLITPTPANQDAHTLTVNFKAYREGKAFLRTKSFSFNAVHPSEHFILRFQATPNEEPTLTLEVLGESLLQASGPTRHAGDAFHRIGRFESASGNHHRAASALLVALQAGLSLEDDTAARLHLAEAYGTIGAPEEAEAELERMATTSPDPVVRARAWLLIQRLASRDGRHERVIDAYRHVSGGLPHNLLDEASTLAGLSSLALRSFGQATELFRAVTKSGSEAPFARFGQAQALAGQGDAFTATTLLTKLTQTRALFVDPIQSKVSSHAHAALGFQWLEQGRYQEAIQELARVPSDHPMSHASLFAIGWCLRRAGEHVQAIAVFDDLLTRAPEGLYAHEARLAAAASYADLRAPVRSVSAYRTALDALGGSAAALERLRVVVRNPAWDPLSPYDVALPVPARRLIRDTKSIALAVERYRWFIQVDRDLRRTLAERPRFPTAKGSTTLGERLNTRDDAQLLSRGQELLAKLEAAEQEARGALATLIVEAIDQERDRLEGWSIAASLGIARNLRDDIGTEVLTLE